VQILLAILVGSPSAAERIFREIMTAMPESDIGTVFAKMAASGLPESPLCARISTELAGISRDTPTATATSEYQRWCPTVARYSFHTRAMTSGPAPAGTP